MASNEAAERLRRQLAIRDNDVADSPGQALLDKALAAERRATVERIRERLEALPTYDKRSVPGGLHVMRAAVRAILDEEAQGATEGKAAR